MQSNYSFFTYPLNLTLIDDSDYLINWNEVVSRFKTLYISRKS